MKEGIINIASTLSYIHEVAENYLDESRLHDINVSISKVEAKSRDKRLYLAVVGEFSSGKSTFINALLGRHLLKEAVMPTTACATYIENTHDQLTIKTKFSGEKKDFNVNEKDFSSLNHYISKRFGFEATNIQQIIDLLTSEQKVAKEVVELHLYIPEANIPDNVIIIDTPGFNPGAESTKNHAEITSHIVDDVADAAIILTPQEQAMSATLSNFLLRHLRRCLHRCTFVVTKFDCIGKAQRTDVLNYVQKRINIDLGLDGIIPWGVCALSMLPVKKVPDLLKEDWKMFQQQFNKLTNELWLNLKRSHDIVLMEHLLILVQSTANQCVGELEVAEQSYRKEKEFLEEHKIDNIRSVSLEMASSANSELSKALSDFKSNFKESESLTKEKAGDIMRAKVMSLSTFKNDMLPNIRNITEEEASRAMKEFMEKLNKKAKAIITKQLVEMSNIFKSHYNGFPTLTYTDSIPNVDSITINDSGLEFNNAMSNITSHDKKEDKDIGGGAVGGGVVGLALFGPVGGLIGALAGACFGFFLGDRSKRMYKEAVPLVNEEIEKFYKQLDYKVAENKAKLKQEYSRLIESFANKHIESYGKKVANLIKQREEKIKSLDYKLKSLRDSIKEMKLKQIDIEEDLALLKVNK